MFPPSEALVCVYVMLYCLLFLTFLCFCLDFQTSSSAFCYMDHVIYFVTCGHFFFSLHLNFHSDCNKIVLNFSPFHVHVRLFLLLVIAFTNITCYISIKGSFIGFRKFTLFFTWKLPVTINYHHFWILDWWKDWTRKNRKTMPHKYFLNYASIIYNVYFTWSQKAVRWAKTNFKCSVFPSLMTLNPVKLPGNSKYSNVCKYKMSSNINNQTNTWILENTGYIWPYYTQKHLSLSGNCFSNDTQAVILHVSVVWRLLCMSAEQTQPRL